MKKAGFIIMITACLLLWPAVCLGGTDWQVLKTEAFTVFYPSDLEEVAREVLRILEFYRPQVEKLTGNRRYHLPVVIDDTGIAPNGLANPLLDYVHLFWYPPKAGLLGTVEDWNALVAVHEYTHILQMTNVGKGPKILCSIFGNIFSPNVAVPGWVIEGITVYSESQLSSYQGRLNDGKFDAYIGARVAADRFPSILDATFEPHEFQLEGIYTYGGLFFNYLAQTYGEEKLAEFFTVHGSSLRSLDQNTEEVFGKSFPELWEEWKAYETARFKDFTIDGERITNDGWYVATPVVAVGEQGERLIYYQREKQTKAGLGRSYYRAEIVARNLFTQEEKVVVATTSSFTLPIKVRGAKLYYGVYELKAGYDNALSSGYGYYTELREKDLQSGKDRLVLAGDLRAYELLPDGTILYASALKNGFGSQLYLYDPGAGSRLLFEVPYLVDEMAADEGRIVFSARKKGENNHLYLFTLETGEFTPLVATPYGEYGIALVGERLFFHANYQQVYGVYCYDFSTAQVYKMTTGNYATEPAYDEARGELYFVGLHADGFDLYRQKAIFSPYQLPAALPTRWPDWTGEGVAAEAKQGGYGDNLRTLTPKIMFPEYLPRDDGYVAGLYFLGSDAIGHFPIYQVGLLYDATAGRWGIDSLVTLNLFPPFLANLGYQSFADRPLYLDLKYPLYNRLSPGLSAITVGLACSYGTGFGAELVPSTAVGFNYPGTKFNLELQTPVEDLHYAGQGKRIGYYGGVEANRLWGNGELTLKAQGFIDPDKQDDVFPRIRGYQKSLPAKRGGVATLEYSHPLLQLRTGSWLFSLYLEDLYASLFVDAAVPDEGAYQLAYGMEVYQELKIAGAWFTVTLNPGISFGFNREGEGFVVFTLKGLTL
ncbi:MAG TPA: hypothetical protein GXX33_08575 [Firmicutes bacterium]|nr:hypothetical protein [Bacillota bacterium]